MQSTSLGAYMYVCMYTYVYTRIQYAHRVTHERGTSHVRARQGYMRDVTNMNMHIS